MKNNYSEADVAKFNHDVYCVCVCAVYYYFAYSIVIAWVCVVCWTCTHVTSQC